MKDKIIAVLKTTYSNLGLSDKAFGGVASILEKTVTNEEDIAAAVAAPEISALVKAIQGETDSLRGKNAQITKELDELKRQKNDGPEKDEKPDGKDADTAALVAKIEAMENRMKERDEQARHDARIASIKEKLVSGGSKNENILGLVLKGAAISDDETDESAAERLKKEYDTTYKQFYGDGPMPPAGGGPGAEGGNPDKALIDALVKSGKLPNEGNNH